MNNVLTLGVIKSGKGTSEKSSNTLPLKGIPEICVDGIAMPSKNNVLLLLNQSEVLFLAGTSTEPTHLQKGVSTS